MYKLKRNKDVTIRKYKAKFTAKVFTQREGVDFTKTFAPVLKYESGKFLLLYCIHLGYEIIQINIKTSFLNSSINEEIYVTQPQGFEFPGKVHLVCKLNEFIYVLNKLQGCGI